MRDGGAAWTAPPPGVAPSSNHHSQWRSPVPYLFGGFAAMLCLIGFALLILACSYWKLSGHLDHATNDGDGGEQANPESGGDAAKPCYEPKFLVIMAGQKKPTFIATPASMGDAVIPTK